MSTQRQNAIKLLPSLITAFAFLLFVYIVSIGNWNFNMARKRIALSIDPEYHELLSKLAEYQKKTVTGVVTDFLDASRPAAEAMLIAFQELEKGVDQNEILKESSSFWFGRCCKKFTGLNSKAPVTGTH